MNSNHNSLAIGYRNRFLPMLFTGMLLFFFSSVFSGNPPVDPSAVATEAVKTTVVVEKPMTHEDSVAKAKEDALVGAEMQRKETINTVLTVIGSVLAIVFLLFLTWKLSSGGSKAPAQTKRPVSQGNPSDRERALSRK